MDISKSYFSDLFQEIKHNDYKLTEEEISVLLKIVKDEYNQELFGSTLLCLSYGSTYIEEQEPLLFKKLLKKNLDAYDIGEVFDCIRMTGTTKSYKDEIVKYSMFENWDFDTFEANANAVEALGNYIFKSKNKELYNFLINQYSIAYTKFDAGIPDDEHHDYLFLFRSYLSAINFSIEGTKSYTRKRITMDDLKNDNINIPKWNS